MICQVQHNQHFNDLRRLKLKGAYWKPAGTAVDFPTQSRHQQQYQHDYPDNHEQTTGSLPNVHINLGHQIGDYDTERNTEYVFK